MSANIYQEISEISGRGELSEDTVVSMMKGVSSGVVSGLVTSFSSAIEEKERIILRLERELASNVEAVAKIGFQLVLSARSNQALRIENERLKMNANIESSRRINKTYSFGDVARNA